MTPVFICDYVRTPIGRYAGALSSVRPDDLAALTIRALIDRNPGLAAGEIDDVVMGCANQAGEDNRNVARMAALLAGLADTVPGTTMNRLCGSGMDAILTAARAVQSGEIDLAIAGGVESMSRAPFVMPKADTAFSRMGEIHDTTIGWRFVNAQMAALHGVDSMPETAENVAEEFSISRQDQDRFAAWSQQKAAAAIAKGRLAKEVVPVPIPARKGPPVIVERDEHPRPDTSVQKLAALPAPFRSGGSVTAGNSSGVNDGAAALIIASEAAAKRHGLRPLARILGGAAAGVPPRVMGIGPVFSTRKLLQRLDLPTSRFDVIEINEAFASQALASCRELDIGDEDPRLNRNGGAIALGHPLGMSGARITGSAAVELHETGGRLALATMCVGVGQGISIALERVDGA